jgi:hypothetical protein
VLRRGQDGVDREHAFPFRFGQDQCFPDQRGRFFTAEAPRLRELLADLLLDPRQVGGRVEAQDVGLCRLGAGQSGQQADGGRPTRAGWILALTLCPSLYQLSHVFRNLTNSRDRLLFSQLTDSMLIVNRLTKKLHEVTR